MAPIYAQNTAKRCQIRSTLNLPFKRTLHMGYMGLYPAIPMPKGSAIPLSVLRLSLCVSHFTPWAWLRPAFTDVGPNALLGYYIYIYITTPLSP